MGTTDIFLLVFLVIVLLVGFFWGAVRSLMIVAAWLLAFFLGAYLQLELGSYLGRQWTDFVPSWSEMAAFGIIYVGLLAGAPFVVYLLTRSGQHLTRFQTLDDLVGAAFAVFVGLLAIAGLIVVLGTYYGTDVATIAATGGPQWTADLHRNILSSSIGSSIADTLIPIIDTVLGPLLPPDVREVTG